MQSLWHAPPWHAELVASSPLGMQSLWHAPPPPPPAHKATVTTGIEVHSTAVVNGQPRWDHIVTKNSYNPT